jgi:ATP-dependent 26S proteasome regulatory subunit
LPTAVFLQQLEYFEGTIFMTTNRVDCIDPAFESRIHLSLTYPTLTEELRRNVFTSFIRTLKDIDTSKVTNEDIGKFAASILNGRQIKNMVKMAGLLATRDGGVLKPEHVESMMRIVQAKQ